MIAETAVTGLGSVYSLRYRNDTAAVNAISGNVFLQTGIFSVM